MENTVFIEKSYVVASVLNVKIKQLKEHFVTMKEVNYVSNELQKKLNEQNLNAIISDNIDTDYFEVSDIIEINRLNGFSLESIIERYQGYLGLDILMLIWNENNIVNYLDDLKNKDKKREEFRFPLGVKTYYANAKIFSPMAPRRFPQRIENINEKDKVLNLKRK